MQKLIESWEEYQEKNKARALKGYFIAFMILTLLLIVCLANASDKAVIHHTASHDVSAQTIDQWHKEKGWDGIGYHFIIRADGTIEQGRPISKQGAHAKGRNDYVGIALTGYDEFTPLQIKSLKKLIIELKISHIERHHQDCPGKGLNIEKISKELNLN